jgi:hypothetical protein
VSDGIRTHDRRDHNPELYQLSYAHRGATESTSGCATPSLVRVPRAGRHAAPGHRDAPNDVDVGCPRCGQSRPHGSPLGRLRPPSPPPQAALLAQQSYEACRDRRRQWTGGQSWAKLATTGLERCPGAAADSAKFGVSRLSATVGCRTVERAEKHERASKTHRDAARRHDKAAEFWTDKGEVEAAEFERRNARIERDASELESDRARFYRNRRS